MAVQRTETECLPAFQAERGILLSVVLRLTVLAGFVLLGTALAGVLGRADAVAADDDHPVDVSCSTSAAVAPVGLRVAVPVDPACVAERHAADTWQVLTAPAGRIARPMWETVAREGSGVREAATGLVHGVDATVIDAAAALRGMNAAKKAPEPVEAADSVGQARRDDDATPSRARDHSRFSAGKPALRSFVTPDEPAEDRQAVPRGERPAADADLPFAPLMPPIGAYAETMPCSGVCTPSATLPAEQTYHDAIVADVVVGERRAGVRGAADDPSVSPD